MNENVQRLIEQATEYKPNAQGQYVERLNPEKLVELVVEECVKIADLKERGHKDFNSKIPVGRYLKRHFGVI